MGEHSQKFQKFLFNEASQLRKLSIKFGEIFSSSNFANLPNVLRSKKPIEYKVEQVHKYIEINLVHNIIPVMKFNPLDINLGLEILKGFKELCSGKNESLDNKTKLSLLNVKFALSHEAPDELLTFEEAVRISSELANVVDVNVSEIYFWYCLLLWPNGECDAERSPYYDEKKILTCIKRLKEINDGRATERYVNKERQRKVNEQKPIFFLTEGNKFNRVVRARDPIQQKPGSKGQKVKRLSGKIINSSCIEAVLPGGTKIALRASYLRWNRSSTASNVTFELGFSLAGPIAPNIEKYSDESDRIRAHNDGDMDILPAVSKLDFEDSDIWEPFHQYIECIGEERDTVLEVPAPSSASGKVEVKLNSVSSSPIMATPLLPTSSAAAPKDCTVLDDDPAIVRVNKNSVKPERKNLNVFGGKKLKSSPSKKEEIKEKKK